MKPFVSVSAGKRANRIISLLSTLEINERLVNDDSEFKNINLKIDAIGVLNKLNKVRNESKIILESGVKN